MRHLLRAVLLLCLLASFVCALPAHVQTQSAVAIVGTTVSVTMTSAGAGNSFVITAVAYLSNTASIATDKGDSCSTANGPLSASQFGTSTFLFQYYCTNIAGGTTVITFTSAGGVENHIIASEFSGQVTVSLFDVTASQAQVGVTSVDSTATTSTTQSSEVLVGSFALRTTGHTLTAGSGYTIPTNGTLRGVNCCDLVQEYQIVSSIGAYHATLTSSGASEAAAIIGTYKAVTGAPVGQFPRMSWRDEYGNMP